MCFVDNPLMKYDNKTENKMSRNQLVKISNYETENGL